MAIPKVMGIETEYGIMVRPAEEQNHTSASSLLINAYLDSLTHAGHASNRHRVAWDFSDETPGADARGVLTQFALPPDVETHLVNSVLTNGARYYVDHAHPEYSSPEVVHALDAVVWDRAGEVIVQRSMEAVTTLLGGDWEVIAYKNNSDGKGNSYGCHENYFLDRATPFPDIVAHLSPHLITRQIFCGAGKVGHESQQGFGSNTGFQISQRADFFEEEVGLETTIKRPIINTRDEPHADPAKYRRLHVIIGDANLSEWATLIKLGSTAFVLCLIEDGCLTEDLRPRQPVSTLRSISDDLGLEHRFLTRSGREVSALEVQWELLEASRKWAANAGFESVGGEEIGQQILDEWGQVLADLDSSVESTADRVEWVAKRQLCTRYMQRHQIDPQNGWNDARIKAIDLQYHDLRPDKGLAARLGFRRVADPAAIEAAVEGPPATTRAYFRGECLKRFPDAVVSANWDSMVVDAGGKGLSRIPMLEPLRGTAATLGPAFEESATMAGLLNWIGRG